MSPIAQQAQPHATPFQPLRVSTKYPTHEHFASRLDRRRASTRATLRDFVPDIYCFSKDLKPFLERTKEKESGRKGTDTKRLLYI